MGMGRERAGREKVEERSFVLTLEVEEGGRHFSQRKEARKDSIAGDLQTRAGRER